MSKRACRRGRNGAPWHPGCLTTLLAQSARRLRIVALLYAFVCFMSDPLGAILLPEERAAFVSSPLRSLPSILSIAMALAVAAMAWSRRVPVETVLVVGLLFEVVANYGIAAAQFLHPSRWEAAPPWGGLSWVAVWMLSFTVIIPTPPRKALVAALASASSVPVVAALVMGNGLAPIQLPPLLFLFQLVLPYLLVVLIAYVGARIVYRLGREITRARELGSCRLVERLERVEWGRSGGRSTGCWPVRRPSN